MQTRCLSFFPAALLLLPALATAADTAATDIGGGILQLVLGFALILGLLFATLWVLKKVSVPRGGASQIRIVSAAAVGPRERVVIVDVAGKRLILGVAPGHVSLLTEQAPGTDSMQATGETTAPPTTPAFSLWLQRTLAKRNEK